MELKLLNFESAGSVWSSLLKSWIQGNVAAMPLMANFEYWTDNNYWLYYDDQSIKLWAGFKFDHFDAVFETVNVVKYDQCSAWNACYSLVSRIIWKPITQGGPIFPDVSIKTTFKSSKQVCFPCQITEASSWCTWILLHDTSNSCWGRTRVLHIE